MIYIMFYYYYLLWKKFIFYLLLSIIDYVNYFDNHKVSINKLSCVKSKILKNRYKKYECTKIKKPVIQHHINLLQLDIVVKLLNFAETILYSLKYTSNTKM